MFLQSALPPEVSVKENVGSHIAALPNRDCYSFACESVSQHQEQNKCYAKLICKHLLTPQSIILMKTLCVRESGGWTVMYPVVRYDRSQFE
ncbi:hypothetical protein Plhal304r1_c004g0017351 [Plasmopara halstedii]